VLGLTYQQIRRLLRELGLRLVADSALGQSDDDYWLEAREADALAAGLDRNELPPSYVTSMIARQVIPPSALPEKGWLARLVAREKPASSSLKGYGASAGTVTAPACVLRGPGDFGQMRPGDVIVAVTTTPAWTPLFAIASAVVTDIGGPLSHSSIVAHEYGIPAVMATCIATRRIHTGQMLTVDGTAGTVTPA
jgi:phosphohistidine swiveling domain-containing protein